MAAIRTTRTVMTAEPLITAYALETAWNTAKLSVSAHYTTYTWGFTPELILDAVVVGETGSDGKFGGSVPAQTMIYGLYTPYYGFTVPIPTPTVTNTLDWSKMECSPDIYMSEPDKFVCEWLAQDPTGFGVTATATSTIRALAVTTLSRTTTYTSASYYFSDRPENNDGRLPPAAAYFDVAILLIIPLIIIILAAACPLIVGCFFLWPRERRRKRQRTRLRQLWLDRQAPYDQMPSLNTNANNEASTAERGLLSPQPHATALAPHAQTEMMERPRTPTEATPFMVPIPSSPGPPSQSHGDEMHQKLTSMEEEIRRLREQLNYQDARASLNPEYYPRPSQPIASGSNVKMDD